MKKKCILLEDLAKVINQDRLKNDIKVLIERDQLKVTKVNIDD